MTQKLHPVYICSFTFLLANQWYDCRGLRFIVGWEYMKIYIRPPDDVYWYFRRLSRAQQVGGAECLSKEDGCLYRLRADRRICRVVEGIEQETIDSIPLCTPAGARVMTGVGWGFHMHISTFYQQIIAHPANKETPE
jgi:hypothetical protein